MEFEELREVVENIELVDGHAHNIVSLDSSFPFIQSFSEATGPALSYAPYSLSFKVLTPLFLFNCWGFFFFFLFFIAPIFFYGREIWKISLSCMAAIHPCKLLKNIAEPQDCSPFAQYASKLPTSPLYSLTMDSSWTRSMGLIGIKVLFHSSVEFWELNVLLRRFSIKWAAFFNFFSLTFNRNLKYAA